MIKVLTQGFSDFLRRRRALSHFGRHPLPDSLGGHGSTEAPPEHPMASDLLVVARDSPAAAITRLQSHKEGLSAAEAAERLARNGPNEVAHEKPVSWVAAVALLPEPFRPAADRAGGGVVTGRRRQGHDRHRRHGDAEHAHPFRAGGPLAPGRREPEGDGAQHRLRSEPGTRTPAQRQAAKPTEIPLRDLVRGDLVALSAGDMVPADCRVLAAQDLLIAQAATTGESAPGEIYRPARRGCRPARPEQPLLQRHQRTFTMVFR